MPRWDLEVYDRHEQRVLIVEVKNKRDTTPEWAAQLRSNIFAHGVYPNARFFLLAFPDRFYLWTDSRTEPKDREPDYTIDARPLLQPYFDHAGVNANHISDYSLELIIMLWLGEIMHSDTALAEAESAQWLVESGLYAAISGGRFEREVVV